MKLKSLLIITFIFLTLTLNGKKISVDKNAPKHDKVENLNHVCNELQKSNEILSNQIEILQNQLSESQSEINMLKDANKFYIDKYHDDTEQRISHWFTWLGIIITVIVGFIGIGCPLIFNKKQDKIFEDKLNQMNALYDTKIGKLRKMVAGKLQTMNCQLEVVKKEVENAKNDAASAKDSLNKIMDLEKNLDGIKNQVDEYNEEVKRNVDKAKASVYLSMAYTYESEFDANKDTLKYDAAMRFFNMAESLDPDNPMVYNGRGKLKMMKGDYNEALEDVNIAIEKASDLPILYHNRSYLYKQIANNQNLSSEEKEKYYDKVIEDEQTAIKLEEANKK